MREAREEFNKALGQLEGIAGDIDALTSSLDAKRPEFRDVRLSVLNAGRDVGLDATTMGLILHDCERPPQMAELVGKACANLRRNLEVHDRAVQRRAS